MTKKISILSAVFILMCFAAQTQTVEEIKRDTGYIWGQGNAATLNQADQLALQSVISLISTNVQSQFTWLYEANGKTDTTKVNILVKTYSGATLNDAKRIIISDEPEARVFRYIKKSEISKVFAQRKIKCQQFTADADKAKTDSRLADALRNYYWALVLLRSIPDGNNMTIPNGNGVLLHYLKNQIDEIFANTRISATKASTEENATTYDLEIKYMNQPAANFDYTYWDGRDWSPLISAKDGRGFSDFSGSGDLGLKDIKMKAEYIFESEMRIDKELETVMQNSELVPFRNSVFLIPVNNIVVSDAKKQNEVTNSQSTTNGTTTNQKTDSIPKNNLKLVENPQKYVEIINKVAAAIRSKQYENGKDLFTAAGYDMYDKLVHYGKAQIIGEYEIDAFQNGEKVVCRSIPMRFAFENNTRKFVENVDFYFDKDMKIEAVSFALNQKARNSIAAKTQWSESDRVLLINFLQHLKTAYSLKRLDYLESVFSDNALIIVGTVVKLKPNADNPYKDNKIVKFNQVTKQDYIKNLSRSFKSNEFININFEESTIKKAGKGGNIYGIQIKQNYFSSNYGDEGWLFLMVDLNNPDQPIIHVRTWQPEPNEDGSIFDLYDFQ